MSQRGARVWFGATAGCVLADVAVLRLSGRVAITVHTVVPVLAVAGWALIGPRRRFSRRIAWLSLIFPVCWLAFTLIRGAIAHWYPYPFIDVTQLGYGLTAVNCVWMALLFLGLAAGALRPADRMRATLPM